MFLSLIQQYGRRYIGASPHPKETRRVVLRCFALFRRANLDYHANLMDKCYLLYLRL